MLPLATRNFLPKVESPVPSEKLHKSDALQIRFDCNRKSNLTVIEKQNSLVLCRISKALFVHAEKIIKYP